MDSPQELIRNALGPYLVPDKSYPGELPDALAPWYCYAGDGGHSIAIISEDHAHLARTNPADYLVPAPVRAVLRSGYRVSPEPPHFVIAKLPYDSVIGLEGVEGVDFEFDPPMGPASEATPAEPGLLQVGERYPTMSFPVPEKGEYNYYHNGHELRIFWSSPSETEIQDIREGDARFALYVHQDVIFLLFRFGTLPWSDAPFSIHLVPDDLKAAELPGGTSSGEAEDPAGGGVRALLLTILTDARTGIVHALRGTTFSPDFTRRLHAAIRRQGEAPWPGREAYDAQLREAYARFRTSAQMAKNATARTRGGG